MASLEGRIERLKKTAVVDARPTVILEFVEPGRGTVELLNLATGLSVERVEGESEAQFFVRSQQAGFKTGERA